MKNGHSLGCKNVYFCLNLFNVTSNVALIDTEIWNKILKKLRILISYWPSIDFQIQYNSYKTLTFVAYLQKVFAPFLHEKAEEVPSDF